MFRIQVHLIINGVVGPRIYTKSLNPENFTRNDYDFVAETNQQDTMCVQPRVDEDESTTMVMGDHVYRCRATKAKILQLGRHADNDIVISHITFPRFAFRLCMYKTNDDYILKIKAAGYGEENGYMVMKLPDTAVELNDDYSTSNPVIMLNTPLNAGDMINYNGCIISIKGATYKMNFLPHFYENVVDKFKNVAGYICGDVYVLIDKFVDT